ncbi:pyridoxamine 5'-phosphate oxidase [Terricaulis sp.]|uniref:pyridoxamine 5'-phosphate oxidase n=1 Tax=Terricaulis sp. TaxID=2768686 RepID=UPI003783C350
MSGDDLIPPSPQYDPNAAPPPDDATLFAESEPFALFERWFKEAKAKELSDPNAMALATVDASGAPDVRMVLMKGFEQGGFVFFSNADSAKGQQLAANAHAAVVFHWKSLKRQVRVRGVIRSVGDAEADAYFQTRDRGARIGAWASMQSRPLEDRFALEKRIAEYAAKFGLGEVPRPAHWQGWRLTPLSIEFWRDRPFRLHDRLSFTRSDAAASWVKTRLYP